MDIYIRGKNVSESLNEHVNVVESQYNVVWNVFGGKAIFNNLTNALVFLSDKEYHERFQNELIRNTLIQCGIMVNSHFSELNIVKKKLLQENKKNKIIVIAPTTLCNMKCPYCFEKDFIETEVMDKSMEEQITKYIISNYIESDLTIIWYGGEPLLQFDHICSISKSVKKAFEKNNKKFSSGMITNGYLLTRDKVDVLCHECNLKLVQITLDGMEQCHNERRMLKNNEGTFREIIDNIDYACDFIKISLRINVDESNICDVCELLDFCKTKRNWKEKVVPYVAPVTRVHDKMTYEAAMPRINFSTLFSKYFIKYFTDDLCSIKIEDNADDYFFSNCCSLERKAWRGLFPHSLSNVCGVVNSSYITIGPTGKLYKCWDTIGVEDKCIGDIYSSVSDKRKKWESYIFPNECEQCKYLPICMGGCIREYFDTGKVSCPYDKEIHENILKIIFEELRKG